MDAFDDKGTFNPPSSSSVSFDYTRKRKNRRRRDESVEETLAKWKEINSKLNADNEGRKPNRKAPAKGSKKGCMRGKPWKPWKKPTTTATSYTTEKPWKKSSHEREKGRR